MTLQIGNVVIPNRLVLAPMAGITNLPFRIICRELGAGLVVTELVSAEGLIRKGGGTLELLETSPAEKPVAVQIFGSKPESMAESARMLSDMGCWDIIDINMGCPVRKVLKSGSGSALLKDLQLAERLTAEVVKASSVPVTVKIRSGWNRKNMVARELAVRLEGVGAAAVAVHARTTDQGFSGKADWAVIAEVKSAVKIPVIGNGDVVSPRDARIMLDSTGCDGVMIGRGVRGNPWIFRETAAYLENGGETHSPERPDPERPERDELLRVLLRHLDLMASHAGNHHGAVLMRPHVAWYCRGLPDVAEFRKVVNAISDTTEMARAVTEFLTRSQD